MTSTTHATKMLQRMKLFSVCNQVQLLQTLSALNSITMSSISRPLPRCANSLKISLNPAITLFSSLNAVTSNFARTRTCFQHSKFPKAKLKILGSVKNPCAVFSKSLVRKRQRNIAHVCNTNSMLWQRWDSPVTSSLSPTSLVMQRKLAFA
ncbi:unannotated protein [freshwater metagenome]|uniref:Unannotated protein n=1 Tax=freshwater metagenome TaxID=449393 RepID=A0A6J7TQS2_9ZZZZ